jgi:hypothetical protein
VVDEVGVPWLEVAGDWAVPCEGEALPEEAVEAVEAPSFFLEDDLVESLARESCSCWWLAV